jgi:hypothetical protein
MLLLVQKSCDLDPANLLACAADLWREDSSSPLMGSLPPSNTTSGSTPWVRSICTRDMKYATNLQQERVIVGSSSE